MASTSADGAADVPGPVDVVVIGAGVSGLICARELNMRFNVVILEGGRVASTTFGGYHIDLGGTWDTVAAVARVARPHVLKAMFVHGRKSNVLHPIAKKKLKLQLTLLDWEGKHDYPIESHQNGRPLSERKLGKIEKYLERFEEALFDDDERREAMGMEESELMDLSLQDYVTCALQSPEVFGNTEKFKKWISPEFLLRYTVASAILTDYAADPSELSLLYFDQDDEQSGGNYLLGPPSYTGMMEHFARNLNIQHHRRVTVIDANQRDDLVHVTTESGHVYRAQCVVCTAPLGVLQRNAITFRPELSAEKQQAIAGMGMACLGKVFLRFESVFWDPDTAIFENFNERTGLQYPSFLNINWQARKSGCKRSDAPAVLMAFIGGSFARSLEALPTAEVQSSCMEALRDVFGPDIPNPVECLMTKWGSDELCGGSYSFIRKGSSPVVYENLAKPECNGRVVFAGEATNRANPACMHGAYETGLRAAREVTELLARE